MSAVAIFLEIQYRLGRITKQSLRNAVVAGTITPEEYEWITGEPYEVPDE